MILNSIQLVQISSVELLTLNTYFVLLYYVNSPYWFYYVLHNFQDYVFHTGKSEYEDVLQCNNAASSATARGHQSPSAFLIKASGLEKVIKSDNLWTTSISIEYVSAAHLHAGKCRFFTHLITSNIDLIYMHTIYPLLLPFTCCIWQAI